MNINLNASNLVKCLLCLLVFNFHFFAVFNGLSSGQSFGDISFFVNRGDVAVSGFLFLSGYALFINPRNDGRCFLSILSLNYFRVLFPFIVVICLSLLAFNLGYGEIAVKVSGLGYGWSLVMPYGMLTNLSTHSALAELSMLVLEKTDRLTLVGWFVVPLLMSWTLGLIYLKAIKGRISKDLAVVVALSFVVLEFSQPFYKGLVSCFIVGALMASLYRNKRDRNENIFKSKLGVMYLPLSLAFVILSLVLAWLVKTNEVTLATIYNMGFVWVVYLVTDMHYLASLPIVMCACAFISKMSSKNPIFTATNKLAPNLYPFLLVNFGVFGAMANIMYDNILPLSEIFENVFPLNLYVLYVVVFVLSSVVSIFIKYLTNLTLALARSIYVKVIVKGDSHV